MIAVVDYGMGNLRSVHKALEKVGSTARVTSTPQQIRNASAIVLPGVGAFKDCILNLEKLNLIEPILQSVKSGKPFLGICLGLQVLFTESDEFGKTPGLDLIKGRVVHFSRNESSPDSRLKIPHMGWNSLSLKKNIPIFNKIEDGSFFYFVHSYYVVPDDTAVIATTTSYGIDFTSSIQLDNIVACQFLPETSQQLGLHIVKYGRRFSVGK